MAFLDGLLVAPGFGNRGIEGKISAIKYVRENKNNVCPTLTFNMGSGGHNVPLIKTKYPLKKGIDVRKLTPRETANFQGFPKTFKFPKLADSHLYSQFGNSVTVPLIKKIGEDCKKVIDLLFFKGYTQKEASEELEIPLGTIKTRNRLCINKLRAIHLSVNQFIFSFIRNLSVFEESKFIHRVSGTQSVVSHLYHCH